MNEPHRSSTSSELMCCQALGRGAALSVPGIVRLGVVKALRRIADPEFPANLYDLGLVYQLDIQPGGEVSVAMTLTNPHCASAAAVIEAVADAIAGVTGVSLAEVRLVIEPRWTLEAMPPELRERLPVRA